MDINYHAWEASPRRLVTSVYHRGFCPPTTRHSDNHAVAVQLVTNRGYLGAGNRYPDASPLRGLSAEPVRVRRYDVCVRRAYRNGSQRSLERGKKLYAQFVACDGSVITWCIVVRVDCEINRNHINYVNYENERNRNYSAANYCYNIRFSVGSRCTDTTVDRCRCCRHRTQVITVCYCSCSRCGNRFVSRRAHRVGLCTQF